MPLFAFRERRFHPDLALVQGFLVGKSLWIAFYPFHIVRKKGAVDAPTTRTFSTLRFHGADITDCSISAVLYFLDSFQSECWTQHLALGTAIEVLTGIVGKLCQSIIAHVVLSSLSDRDVGPDMGLFDGFEVLSRSIQAISRDLFWPQTPTKAGMPEQIQHGMIVHHLPRSHQHRQNDATLASIDDIVRMITKMSSPSFEAHWRGVGVGGADPKIRRPLIGATDLSLLSTFLGDPIMASRVLRHQFLAFFLREGGGQKQGRGCLQERRFFLRRGGRGCSGLFWRWRF